MPAVWLPLTLQCSADPLVCLQHMSAAPGLSRELKQALFAWLTYEHHRLLFS